MDLGTDSVRAFTLEASSAAWDGVVGAGDRAGSITRSFRIASFSNVPVSAGGDSQLARPGRTIPPIGWGSPIRIVRSVTATGDFRPHAADPVPGDRAHNPMRDRNITRRPGPTQRKPAVGPGSAKRAPLPARVRVEAAGIARVRHTVATTGETAPRRAIAPLRPTAAAHTDRVRPTDATTGKPALRPPIDRALLIAAVDRIAPAPALTVVASIAVGAAPTVVAAVRTVVAVTE